MHFGDHKLFFNRSHSSSKRPFPALLQQLRRRTRSLRFLFASSTILALGVSFLVPDTIIYKLTSDQVRSFVDSLYARANYLLAFAFDGWIKEILRLMESIADSDSFRTLQTSEMGKELQSFKVSFPGRRIDVWTPDGKSIVSSGGNPDAFKGISITTNESFQGALSGRSTMGIIDATGAGNLCLLAAQPIYSTAASGATGKPAAVLTFCIPFYAVRHELTSQPETFRNPLHRQSPALRPMKLISLTQGQYQGAEIIAVTRSGRLFFPLSNLNDSVSAFSPAAIAAGPWGPFVRLALSNQPQDQVAEVSVQGHRFLAVRHWIANQEVALMTIVNHEASLQQRLYTSHLGNLALIALMALVVYWLSGGLVRPIQRASGAIRRISQGDFSVHIDDARQDEIGELYDDINATGALLSSFVESQKRSAASDQQLATARQIQRSFLLDQLPQSDRFEIAARFLPAHQVGADWFDALQLGRFLYVVIADVCDKGVPSALFMSVFRSLLRSHILTQAQSIGENKPVDLAEVSILVNEYMATNHGDTCMFATIFMASFDQETGELCYVNAGHESPLILKHRPTGIELETLAHTGPAVGLFPGTIYSNGHTTLAAGDLLFSYTDGLTDARSPEQEGWGLARLQEFLLQLSADELNAASVLEKAYQVIEQYEAGTERFDDLTVLVLHHT